MSSAAISHTLSQTINRPWMTVYEFVVEPRNLSRWAAGLGSTITRTPEGWSVDTPNGPMRIRFTDPNLFGVLDHWVQLPDGTEVFVPMRVVPNGGGTEVLFTLFRSEGVSDAAFARDCELVGRDLRSLKEILEP